MSNEEEEGPSIRADIAVSQFTGYHTAGLWPRQSRRGMSLRVKRLLMDRNRYQVEGPR
jgi:hypothetical protein